MAALEAPRIAKLSGQRVPLANEQGPDVACWSLRMVMYLYEVVGTVSWSRQERAFQKLGLACLLESRRNSKFVLNCLRWTHDRLSREKGTLSGRLPCNFRKMAALLNLSRVEQILLGFCLALQKIVELQQTAAHMDSMSTHNLVCVLADVLRVRLTDTFGPTSPGRWCGRR